MLEVFKYPKTFLSKGIKQKLFMEENQSWFIKIRSFINSELGNNSIEIWTTVILIKRTFFMFLIFFPVMWIFFFNIIYSIIVLQNFKVVINLFFQGLSSHCWTSLKKLKILLKNFLLIKIYYARAVQETLKILEGCYPCKTILVSPIFSAFIYSRNESVHFVSFY